MSISRDVEETIDLLPNDDALKKFLGHPEKLRLTALDRYYDRGEEIRRTDPHKAIELAEIGVDLVRDVPAFYPRREIAQTTAKGLCVCGGCHRTVNDFDSAEAAYRVAYEHLRPILSEPPVELMELYGRVILLRRSQRRFDDAILFSRRGLQIAESAGDLTWTGRMSTYLGTVLFFVDQIKAALYLRKARELLSADDDFSFYLSATQALAATLVEIDESDIKEIAELVTETESLLHKDDHLNKAVTDWTRGTICLRTDDAELAVDYLEKARRAFGDLLVPDSFAICSVDLGRAYLILGNMQATKQMAHEIAEVLKAYQFNDDFLSAASLFIKAALDNELSERLACRLKHSLVCSV